MAKQKKPSAFMKPVEISKELAEVVGKGPMARTEVTKKLWEYIKKHNESLKGHRSYLICFQIYCSFLKPKSEMELKLYP